MTKESYYVEIPIDRLEPATLDRLLADVALRDDTDYGDAPLELPERIEQLRASLRRGELTVVYDLRSETATVLSTALSLSRRSPAVLLP